MTKQEAMRQTRQLDVLQSLGFSRDESEALRRISMTLRRWHEKECGTEGGYIERDETTGKPYWLNAASGRRFPIADREAGAKYRLAHLMGKHPTLGTYIQTDPRGAALYIIRPGDVPEGANVGSYYSRGICVY